MSDEYACAIHGGLPEDGFRLTCQHVKYYGFPAR